MLKFFRDMKHRWWIRYRRNLERRMAKLVEETSDNAEREQLYSRLWHQNRMLGVWDKDV